MAREPLSLASSAMTSCKEAIKDLEVDGKVAADMEDVRLCPIANMKPLIAKMDNSLSTLMTADGGGQRSRSNHSTRHATWRPASTTTYRAL